MNPLLSSIPGDISGLLRRCSPIIAADDLRGHVVDDPTGCSSTLITLDRDTMDLRLEMLRALALDLTDPTGRAHAAWWARAWIRSRGGWAGLTSAALDLLVAACDGHPMTPAQIDTLARLILRLAGRSP